jgi:hypothetical protein
MLNSMFGATRALGAVIDFARGANNPALPAAILVVTGLTAGLGLRALRTIDDTGPPPVSTPEPTGADLQSDRELAAADA